MIHRIQDLNVHSQPDDETVEISGQFLRKDEKVLVEIGGHFHVVEAGELERNLPELSLQQDEKNKVVLPSVKHHSKSALPQDASNHIHHRILPRPASAAPSLYQQSKVCNCHLFVIKFWFVECEYFHDHINCFLYSSYFFSS